MPHESVDNQLAQVNEDIDQSARPCSWAGASIDAYLAAGFGIIKGVATVLFMNNKTYQGCFI